MKMRIGPKMLLAVRVVRERAANNLRTCKIDVARVTNRRALYKNNAIAYGSVNRAIAAGLLNAERLPSGTYELSVNE